MGMHGNYRGFVGICIKHHRRIALGNSPNAVSNQDQLPGFTGPAEGFGFRVHWYS